MKFPNILRSPFRAKVTSTGTAIALAAAMIAIPEIAAAQSNPFAGAESGARQFQQQLTSFALIVGGIGMVACLMLGFFGKLNWKWVATGVGVSFALAVVPGAIEWLSTLAGA